MYNGMRKTKYFLLLVVLTLSCQHRQETENSFFVFKSSKSPKVIASDGMSYNLKDVDMSRSRFPWTSALIQSDWEKCLQAAHAWLKDHPYDKDAFLILSVANLKLAKLALAKFYVDQLLSMHPAFSEANNLKGLIIIASAQSSSDFENAMEYFRKALESDPKHVAALLNLSYTYLILSQYQQALDSFKTTANQCNNCLAALTGLGAAYLELGQFKEAEENLKLVLKEEPKNVFALATLSDIYTTKNLSNEENLKIINQLKRITGDENTDFAFRIQNRANYINALTKKTEKF